MHDTRYYFHLLTLASFSNKKPPSASFSPILPRLNEEIKKDENKHVLAPLKYGSLDEGVSRNYGTKYLLINY